ncbi:fungal-specific transcription factor domain-domain-containing protein [Leucosporidium creatinivorum]|uniref:Fungal-specific transcription factor domain-domain-containing protein n=1 Tax=Leucosporidium creatinivorum TaxID=106004 RepID=A0A1Y2FI11_9BASI|nr:fungal-specific transcription factor domain-domain-containing protein [Leucosporidium creatinivorum]
MEPSPSTSTSEPTSAAQSKTLPETNTTDGATPSSTAPPDSRVRHLRACDRSESDSLRPKCQEESPCSRCVAAGAPCTFNLSSRILASDNGGMPEGSTPANSSTKQQRKAEPSAAAVQAPNASESKAATSVGILDHDETSHFFTTQKASRASVVQRLVFLFCEHSLRSPRLMFPSNLTSFTNRESTRRLSKLSRLAPTMNSAAASEPDWAWLNQLLHSGQPSTGETGAVPPAASAGDDDLEFYPDSDSRPKDSYEAYRLVVEIIPPDLLGELMHIFFHIIHPQWPILHMPSILNGSHRWSEPAFAALIVSMCMLASRYCADERVRVEPENPVSAGYHYFALFRKLRDMASLGHDDAVTAIQSLFFAAQYHCVDTLPHPIAQGLLADAIARCYDGGLHRSTTLKLGGNLEQEIRKRTVWAVYVYDKQMATIAGRPPLCRLVDSDVGTPVAFKPSASSSPEEVSAVQRDALDCEVFKQLILVAAITEKALASCSQPPAFDDNPFLDRLGGRKNFTGTQDHERLKEIDEILDDWVKQLPPFLAERDVDARFRSPTFSPQTEAVLAMEACCRVILAGRRLQLTTASITTNAASKVDRSSRAAELRVQLKQHRTQLLEAIKQLISSGLKLGAAGLLWRCDIFNGYRLLLAGRLTLAVVLSAQEDNDSTCETDAMHVLEACLLLLKHFASAFPTSLGAAETLKETCRVCNVHLSKATLAGGSFGRYAWHRPLPRTTPAQAPSPAATPGANAPPPPNPRPAPQPSFALPAQGQANLPPPLPPAPAPNLPVPTPTPSAISPLPPLPDFPAPAVGVGADANALYPPAPSTSAGNNGGTSDWLDMLSWSATGTTAVEGGVEGAATADGMQGADLSAGLDVGDGGDWAKSGDFSWLWPGGDMVHSGL